MPVARNRDLQYAERYARDLFAADPQMHIDEAARRVNENCRRGLVKTVLSDIRRSVRQEQPDPAKPASQVTIMAARNLQSAARKNAPHPSSSESRAQKHERVKFVESWALDNPLATIEDAREALRQKFGIAVGTSIIANSLRMAKQLWESQRLEAAAKHTPMVPPPTPEPAAPVEAPAPVPVAAVAVAPTEQTERLTRIAQSMMAEGVRLVEILPDNRVRVEFKVS